MPSPRQFSRTFLAIEGLLLLFPSFIGLMMFITCLVAPLTGKPSLSIDVIAYAFCWSAFLSFYSFWHIYAEAMTKKYEKGKKLNRTIGLFAFLGFVLPIVTGIFDALKMTGIEIHTFGILYMPTYMHLLLEVESQTGMPYLIGTISKGD